MEGKAVGAENLALLVCVLPVWMPFNTSFFFPLYRQRLSSRWFLK